MPPLRKHIGFAASSLALLLVIQITGVGFTHISLTQPSNYQQPSGSIDSEVANLQSRLKSSSEEERLEAAMQLARLKGEGAFALLASAVNDASPQVRAAVVRGLAERGDEAAVPILVMRLSKDKDKFVRKTSAYALERFHGEERTAALATAPHRQGT